MALFVVACGILLMLGGAVSLLFGFDIVMTERGAAMTIGGIVALSGGVIAVGIGLALVRLNQILGALEARAAKPARSGGPDRPVVPLASEDDRPSAAVSKPAMPEPGILEPAMPEPATPEAVVPARAVLPSPVRPPPLPAGGSLMPTVATVGLAAGAAAFGAATALGRSRAEEPDPSSQEAVSKDEALPVSAPPDEAAAPPPLPAQARAVDEPLDAESISEAAPSSIALPLDLEEELSRALAETSVPPDSVTPPAVSGPPEDDRSFEDGLSKLLGRSIRPPAIPSESVRSQDLADLIEPGQPTASAPEVEDAASEPLPVEESVDDLSEPMAPVQAGNLADEQQHGMNEASREEPSSRIETFEPALSQPIEDVRDDDDIFGDTLSSGGDDGRRWSETPLADQDDVNASSAPAPPSSVLGTYTIGGRTYRMFGDGSVEAVSEAGEIERFASMDELRKHLARA